MSNERATLQPQDLRRVGQGKAVDGLPLSIDIVDLPGTMPPRGSQAALKMNFSTAQLVLWRVFALPCRQGFWLRGGGGNPKAEQYQIY